MNAPFYWIGVRRGPGVTLPRAAIPFARDCDLCGEPTLFTCASMHDALAAPDRRGRRLTALCLHCTVSVPSPSAESTR